MSDRDTHIVMGVFPGGACYQHFVKSHKACSVCAIAIRCEPATIKKAQKTVPPPPQPPPQPPPIEAQAEPEPFDYFMDSLRGKFDIEETPGERVDMYDVMGDDGEMVMRVYHASDGRMKVMTPAGSQTIDGLGSLEDAEEILKKLL
jgi:hypothetical protein